MFTSSNERLPVITVSATADAASMGVHVGSGERKVLSNTFQLSGDIKKLSGKASIAILHMNERATVLKIYKKGICIRRFENEVDATECRCAASLISKSASSEKTKIVGLYDSTDTS